MNGFEVKNITTAEDLLAALRKGNNQKLEIGFGDYPVPCRLISADEESRLLAQAAMNAAKKNLAGQKIEITTATETMKIMLREATSIEGGVGIPQATLDQLTGTELTYLFDQYISLNHTINPNFQGLKPEELTKIVSGVKEKKTLVRDLYTWQLAGVGKYFLEALLASQTGSEPGTQS